MMVSPRYDRLTLQDALGKIRQARSGNEDHYVQLRQLRFDVQVTDPAPAHRQLVLRSESPEGPAVINLREDGFPRLLRFLDLPPGLGEKLPSSMVASSLNYVLSSRADELVLMRLNSEQGRATLRGLLPASYVRIDDVHILRQLQRLAGAADLQVADFFVREDACHLRLINRRNVDVGRIGQPDPVHMGMDIVNSETGARSLSIKQCVFRVVCANGVLFRDSAESTRRWRHAQVDGGKLREQLAESMRVMLTDAARVRDRYRALHAQKMDDPMAALEAFMREHMLGSPRGRTGERIAMELLRNRDLFGWTAFDFVQAVTAVARTLDIDKRQRFEQAAGDLVHGAAIL